MKIGLSKFMANGNGKLIGGFLLGSAGLAMLGSRPARKIYSHVAAAGLIARDYILDKSERIQACASDVMADANEIKAQYDAAMDEDAEENEEIEE